MISASPRNADRSSPLSLVTCSALRSFAALLLATFACYPVFAEMRAKIPSAERQKEVAQLLESAYQLTALQGNSKKQATIGQLMEAARDKQTTSDERYVVLTTVISLSIDIGDIESWREAVEVLVDTFDVNAEKERTRLLSEFLRSGKTISQLKPGIEECVKLSKLAIEQKRFSDALSLLDLADTAAKRTTNAESIKKLLVTARETAFTRENEWKAFQAAIAKLEANADDPIANLTVGRWHLAEDEDWEMALAFLAKAGDAKWKTAATLEQSSPADSAGQVAVGDAWYAIAEKESSTLKTVLLIHAGHWYETARPNLTSVLMKQLVAKRLAEIAPLQVPKVEKPLGVPKAVLDSTPVPAEWIDLLEWCEGVDWKQRGIDWNDNLEGRPTRDGITLNPDGHGYLSPVGQPYFPLPAIACGSYELELEFSRLAGSGGVSIFFPVHSHNVHLELGNDNADFIGWIDGNRAPDNSTGRRPSMITTDHRKHELRIRVTGDGDEVKFSIDLDHKKNYIEWKGHHSRLRNGENGGWRLSMINHIWVGAAGTRVVFPKIRLRPTGTIQSDRTLPSDREKDLSNGFIRLVNLEPGQTSVKWARFVINQLPLEFVYGPEMCWPRIRQLSVCKDFYGAHAPSRIVCPIAPDAKSFSAVGYNDSDGLAKYIVSIDGKKVFDSGSTFNSVVKVDIPAKAERMELIVDPDGGKLHDHTYWCYPRFHSVVADQVTDKMLDGPPGTLRFKIASSSVGEGTLTHNQPINDSLKSVPLNFRDAEPCDEFIFAHAPSTVTFQIPKGMTRFSAVGFNACNHRSCFDVWADGTRIYKSPVAGIIPINVKLPAGAKTIELRATIVGDGTGCHTFWCFPRLYRK